MVNQYKLLKSLDISLKATFTTAGQNRPARQKRPGKICPA
jgi:hypothetical protein